MCSSRIKAVKDENIGCFFNSFNVNEFVDEKGNEIKSIINFNNFISKNDKLKQFKEIIKGIRKIKKLFKDGKKNKKK